MNNTNQQLFAIYQNISVFYKYRNLVSLDEELSQSEFAKKIQKDKYVLLSAVSDSHLDNIQTITKYMENYNEKSSIKNIRVFNLLLIYPGTDCESKRANMMKFVNHVRYPKTDIMIITSTKISNSVIKGLTALTHSKEHKHHNFCAYTYNLLTTIVPEFELAPEYAILSSADASEYDPDTLPKIWETDPQMVWIGATVGQVIKVTYLSETTIKGINYRVVTLPMD
jgi:DNA-directed RNA polymerase subunit H (RpoH/RPB5)